METRENQPVLIEGRVGPLRGETSVPGDKSISHRAIILGAIADGETIVKGFLPSADVFSTLRALQMMGLKAAEEGAELILQGLGLDGLGEPPDVIDAGNSGTTARLLTGLLAGQQFFSVITGDRFLRRRPMGRVTDPLREMGAHIHGRDSGHKLPISITGRKLKALEYSPPQASAQVKTALLLAGLYADGKTTVTETSPTRDHTERMLKHMGVRIELDGTRISIEGGSRPRGSEVEVPGDISSAAFFIAAALINPNSEILVKGVGINPMRTGVIDIFKKMGGEIEVLNARDACGEPVGDISARSSTLRGIEVGGADIPRAIDELPLISVVGAFAEGETIIKDASELRHKETDRISSMTAELRKLGARVEETDDGMVITGTTELTGAECASWGDHRVAMALAVAGTAARGQTVIADPECVSISFPGFFEALENLR